MYHTDEEPALNITPLVDVMLVLIAILMLTTPVIIYEEQILLPQGSKTQPNKQSQSLDIRVTADKEIFVGGNKYNLREFPDSFRVFSETLSKETKIFIRADERLPYRDVMLILKSIKDAKFTKIALATDG